VKAGTKVGVFGAGGRMGSTVCRAVAADPDLELVAAVDPSYAGLDLLQVAGVEAAGMMVAPDPSELSRAGAAVAVDFTRLDSALENARWCASAGVHAVIGTSGFGPEQLAELHRLFPKGARAHCLVAANFAIGAVLAMRFAEMAAPWFETAEVLELHHDGKVDAPSGTAMATAERMGTARRAAGREWAAEPTLDLALEGARGGVHESGVRIHAVRLRGLVAHQEVLLGTTGQTLSIRHDSYDRDSFMPGVLLAVKAVGGRPGLTVGLDAVLGFDPADGPGSADPGA
jgi:4-hydroxy-tetrahydrodipicolinate reductase